MDKIKKVGFLYDNISRNTGDLAIGIAIKKMLLNIGVKKKDFEEMIPGISNPENYENIIIGGGLLLRNRGDFFYDKFRIKGNFILNSIGIYEYPEDLGYLNNYKYLSVRSNKDKKKLDYLKKKIKVVPDITLLLEDIPVKTDIKNPSIGIHCFSYDNFEHINNIIKKYSKKFYIYLIPITHYNYDFEFLENIYIENINNTKVFLLPIMSPLEIFTIIGKFNYFISYSLHGAYFAYKHNVPFIVFDNKNDSKFRDFMEDRSLEKYSFKESNEIDSVFEKLIKNKPNYTKLLSKDIKILEKHKNDIYHIIFGSRKNILENKIKKKKTYNIFFDDFNKKIKKEIIKLKTQNKKLIKQISSINNNEDKEKKKLQLDLNKIQSSKTYKLWSGYNKVLKKIKLKNK